MRQSAFFADLQRILEAAPGPLTPDIVCRLIAEHWGGCTVKIGRRWQRVELDYRDTPKAVAERYGVTDRTARNWIARRPLIR